MLQFLRESHRINGKVVKSTIANISHLADNEIEALRLALRHKEELSELTVLGRDMKLEQGISIGGVLVLKEIAERLGIVAALGSDNNGKLALWQIIARVLNQGSRLSAVRLAKVHSADQIFKTGPFDENKLYFNLKWISQNQREIEGILFRNRYKEKAPSLYLYDVTSSYLEGTQNVFGSFGYNRDGKRGKKQIVIGMLCDQEGCPLSVEVFPGNTQDPSTVANQIRKAAERFGAKDVTFIGDRGMLKSKQITDIIENNFHYITAITKPQIETLIKQGTIQLGLFDSDLAEVTENNVRYIIRKNPVRAQEIQSNRTSKISCIEDHIKKQNHYLVEHPKASETTALSKITGLVVKFGLSKYVSIGIANREINFTINQELFEDETKLDGCYVIKTDLTGEQADKITVHDRYKDLALVEQAFRSSKTTQLELRPIFVRKEESTRAHAFVVMLAYQIIRYLKDCWRTLDLTVQEGIDVLNQLCSIDVFVKESYAFTSIPNPRKDIRQLLSLSNVAMPKAIKFDESTVSTKAKLNNSRKISNN